MVGFGRASWFERLCVSTQLPSRRPQEAISNRGHAKFCAWLSYLGLYSPAVALYPASFPSFVLLAVVQGFLHSDRSLVSFLPSSSLVSLSLFPQVLIDLLLCSPQSRQYRPFLWNHCYTNFLCDYRSNNRTSGVHITTST